MFSLSTGDQTGMSILMILHNGGVPDESTFVLNESMEISSNNDGEETSLARFRLSSRLALHVVGLVLVTGSAYGRPARQKTDTSDDEPIEMASSDGFIEGLDHFRSELYGRCGCQRGHFRVNRSETATRTFVTARGHLDRVAIAIDLDRACSLGVGGEGG